MKKPSLLLISTYNVGLGVWKKSGLYDREIGYYKKLGQYLNRFGIMTYDKSDEKPSHADYECYYNKKKMPGVLYSILWPFLNLKTIKGYDIIRTNQFCGAWVALLIKLMFRKKIFILRGGYAWVCNRAWFTLLPLLAHIINWLCMAFADLVFFVSTVDRDEYLAKYGLSRLKKCRILPNSVDTELFKPAQRAADGKIRIALTGRLVEMKNFQSVLEAVSNLKEPLKAQVSVDIVGEGEYTDKLKKIVQERGINCRFLGALSNNRVADVLSNSDIFILPQFYASGMSKGILEAMAAGNIVIASDISAHKTNIENKIDGFLCKTDAQSIQQILEYVITHFDDPQIRAISKRVVEKVQRQFSMDEIAKKEHQYVAEIS